MDVVYLLGKGALDRPEFRWSLRSLAANYEHDRVYLVGPDYPSDYTGVQYVPWRQREDKAQDTFQKWRAITSLPDIGENITVMCDDEFFLRKIDQIPKYHWRTAKERGSLRPELPWVKMVARTDALLRTMGIQNALNYDVHIPFVATKEEIGAGMEVVSSHHELPRTVIGNVAGWEGTPIRSDVKVRNANELFTILHESSGFVSTDDETFGSSGVLYLLETLFPEPSRYELGR